MAYSDTWNSAFEATPAGSDEAKYGDDKIRDLKTAVRERMEKDHYFDIAGTDADHGEHVKVTLRVGAAPAGDTDKVIIYAKDVSSKARPHYKDEDNVEYRLEAFVAGTKMWFYQNTAPAGWTIDSTPADAVLAVKGGTNAYNVNGGNQAGTWTQLTHTHVTTVPANGWSFASAAYATAATYLSGHQLSSQNAYNNGYMTASRDLTSAAGSPAATWRPLAQVGIICTKD